MTGAIWRALPFVHVEPCKWVKRRLRVGHNVIVDLPASGCWLPVKGVQALRGRPSWLAACTIPSGNGRLSDQHTRTQVHGGSRAIYRLWIGFSFLFSIQILLFAILVNGVVVLVQELMAIIGFGGVVYPIVAWNDVC